MRSRMRCSHCRQEIVDHPSHCPACGALLTDRGALEETVEPISDWLTESRGHYGSNDPTIVSLVGATAGLTCIHSMAGSGRLASGARSFCDTGLCGECLFSA